LSDEIPLPYDQKPTAPPPVDERPGARTTDRLRHLASVPTDESGALHMPSERRHDWLRARPGVRGFATVSSSGQPQSAAGEIDVDEIQKQVYLAMLARRVGEELGLAQLAELTVEGKATRLFMAREADGSALHVVGTKDMDVAHIRSGMGEDDR